MQAQSNLQQEERFWHSIPRIKAVAGLEPAGGCRMHQTAKNNSEKDNVDSRVELYIVGLNIDSTLEDGLFNYYNLAKSGGKQ